ncbi:T9SS type A sorting domain-containing protein [Adhaeribacter soli]|uniref:T9SS type A sorting domain-containing protein n=1 Tax=Adhaeribacter soli TaxID=2607655 RepID=A0A5N1J5D4_9BACT|nr:T9SS type A sorting domain-containing protein [Adhaeribacter soli]KAA9341004.1 T9SS type A sorting domain-containing protein [Adhaeribacter soli]
MKRTFTKLKGSLAIAAALAALNAGSAFAQSNLDYKAANGVNAAGTYTDLGTAGTAITVANNDDANSAAQPIGFTFNFNGTNFTEFSLNTNGLIKLGNTPFTTATAQSNIFNAAVFPDINIIAPLAGVDLQGAADQTANPTEFRVETTGTAPNRVTTIQFENLADKPTVSGTVTTPAQFTIINFQVKLYEGTNNIEFVYGPWTGSANTEDAQIFSVALKGSSGGPNDRLGLSNLPATTFAPLPWSQARFETTTTFNGTGYIPTFVATKNVLPDAGRTFRFVKYSAPANDLAVEAVYTLGKQPLVAPTNNNQIQAVIKNFGTATQTNVPVTLSVNGGTAFNPTPVIVPSIAPGATVTVTFPSYVAASTGTKMANVSLPADDVPANNAKATSFSVTQSTLSYAVGTTPTSGVGFLATSSNRAFLTRYTTTSTTPVTVTNVRAYIYNDPNAATINLPVFAVVLDSTGRELGRSSVVALTGGDLDAYYNFPITYTTTSTLTNTAFYVGMAMGTYTGNTVFPMGYQDELPSRRKAYYTWAVGSTSKPTESIPTAGNPGRRYMIEAEISTVSGVRDEFNSSAVAVYPNPSKGLFSVSAKEFKGSNLNIEVRDLQGKLVYSGVAADKATSVDLQNAASGVYLLKVYNESEIAVKRIVVQ